MAIVVRCKCGKQLKARDELAGKKVKCPGCGEAVALVSRESKKPKRAPVPERAKEKLRRPEPEDDDELCVWGEDELTGWDNFVAVTDNAICVANLDKKECKRAERDLREGERPIDALGDENRVIRFRSIRKVKLNKRSTDLTVEHGKDDEKTVYFKEAETRDEAFKELRARLGRDWKLSKKELSRAVMSLWTMLFVGIVIGLTVLFYLGAEEGQDADAKSLTGQVVLWLVDVLGPTGILVVGSLLALAGVAWMIGIWMRPPPLMVELEPPGD